MLITAIIPVYNAEEFLPNLFTVLNSQTVNEYEILFIDNNSDDSSAKLLHNFCNNNQQAHYYFFDQKQSSYASRNFGVKKAKGDVYAFTDADCIPEQDWIANIASFYENNPDKISTHILAGAIEMFVANENNLWELYDSIAHLDNKKYAEQQSGATANMIVPKKVFKDVGPFKEHVSGEDTQWSKRASKLGYSIEFRENIKVNHPARDSLRKVTHKAQRIGYGRGQRAKQGNRRLLRCVWVVFLHILRIFYIPTNYEYSKIIYGEYEIWYKVAKFNLGFTRIRVAQLLGSVKATLGLDFD